MPVNITSEVIKEFQNTIASIELHYESFQDGNIQQSLQYSDMLLTLPELKNCLRLLEEVYRQGGEHREQRMPELLFRLEYLFRMRWERIRGSCVDYTAAPFEPLNVLCLNIAIAMRPLPADEENRDQMKIGEGPYFLLMPSLATEKDMTSGSNIHNLSLHEFVLSDDQRLFIPIAACVAQAALSDGGQYTQMTATAEELKPIIAEDKKLKNPNPATKPLSDNEARRVINHSSYTQACETAIRNLNTERNQSISLGSELKRLQLALLSGGVHRVGSGATDEIAGAAANEGIARFALAWQSYTDQEKNNLYSRYPGLEHGIGRILRPLDVNYKLTSYCVELNAENLDTLLNTHRNELYAEPLPNLNLKEFKQENVQFPLEVAQQALARALAGPNYPITARDDLNVQQLRSSFQLSPQDQQIIFGRQTPNALFWAISQGNNPQAALAVQRILSTDLVDLSLCNADGDNVLSIALQHRDPATIKTLLFKMATLPIEQQQVLLRPVSNGQYSSILSYVRTNHLGLMEEMLALPHIQPAEEVHQFKLQLKVPLFMEAVVNGNLSKVQDYLAEGIDINATDELNETALMKAVNGRHIAIMEKLITHDASAIDFQNQSGRTALMLAVISRKDECLAFLLSKNASLTLVDNRGDNALSHGLLNSSLDELDYRGTNIIKMLLFKAVCLPIEEQKRLLPGVGARSGVLAYVCEHAKDLLPELLRLPNLQPSNPAIRSQIMKKIWFEAVNERKWSLIQSIAEFNQASIDSVDAQGNTAMMEAFLESARPVSQGYDPDDYSTIWGDRSTKEVEEFYNIVKYLSDKNANLQIRNSQGKNIFELTAHISNLRRHLLIKIAELPAATQRELLRCSGRYSVVQYAQECCPEIIETLSTLPNLQPSGILDQYRRNMRLLSAAPRGHLSEIKELVHKGVDINTKDQGELTPLLLAIYNNQTETMDYLMQQEHVDISHVLRIAVRHAPNLVPRLLLTLASYPLEVQNRVLSFIPKNNDLSTFSTILAYALKKHPDLIPSLLELPNLLPRDPQRHELLQASGLLRTATQNGWLRVMQALINAGVDKNMRMDEENNTLLMWAINHRQTNTVALLLEQGVDIRARNKHNDNALDIALARSPQYISHLLLKISCSPEAEQRELLDNVSGGQYTSALGYAAAKYPDILPTLIRLENMLPRDMVARLAILGGEDALIRAAANGQLSLVQALLAAGANINAQDDRQNTALIQAVNNGKDEVVRFLLSKHADLRLRNVNQNNALDLAKKRSPDVIPDLLRIMNTLPPTEQEALLKNVSGGRYRTIASYAADKHPLIAASLGLSPRSANSSNDFFPRDTGEVSSSTESNYYTCG